MSTATFKLVYGDDVRRVRVSASEQTRDGLASLARSTFDLQRHPALRLKYQDEDGDLVTVGPGDEDVRALTRLAGDSIPRVMVYVAPDAAPVVVDEEDAEVEAMYEEDEAAPELTPLEEVVKFLSDVEHVKLLQAALGSQVVANLVSDFARDYGSNPLVLITRFATEGERAFADEIGTLRAVFESALADHPKVVAAVEKLASGCGPALGCFSSKAHHSVVLCDGCSDDPTKAAAAVAAGTRDPDDGHLIGVRFKSTVTHNYDVCSTCEATGEFDAEHGPFLYLPRPDSDAGGGFFGRGRCGRRGPGRHHHGRHGPWGPRSGPCGPPHGPPGPCRPHHGPHHGPPHHGPHHGPPHHGPHHGPPHHHGPHRGRGCRGSRRGDAFKRNLLDVASEFVDKFGDIGEEILGRDTARAIKESLEAMRQEAKPEEDADDDKREVPGVPVGEDWTEVAPEADDAAEEAADDSSDPMVRWREQLRVLDAIGYLDNGVDLAIRLLEEEGGNLERVVARIASVRA